jgi:hypothetical protein
MLHYATPYLVMTDDKPLQPPPYQPFRLVTEEAPPPSAVLPRLGPTMAQIVDRLNTLDKVEALVTQALKRLQQTSLMIDGFGSTVNRRLDVLHEEAALTRVALGSPANDSPANDSDGSIPIELDRTVPKTHRQKAQQAFVITGKLLSYGTTLAIVLRLLEKGWPQYEQAIEALLGLVGL